jgi:SAM-dependent methyltransferase
MIEKIISNLYNNSTVEKIVPTLVSQLRNSLSDCETVLDIGCGPSSPLAACKNIKYSVGLEPFQEYINKASSAKIHSDYVNSKIEDAQFQDKSFDAVILIDVIEHMNKESVLDLIEKAKRWAKKKIVVTTPNGYISQPELDGNPLQKHLSGWGFNELRELGFNIYGLAGLKSLRKEKEVEDSMDGNLLVSIKYEPKLFWFGIAVLSQIYTHKNPRDAFEFFCVMDLANI